MKMTTPILLAMSLMTACMQSPVAVTSERGQTDQRTVELVQTDEGWQLLRNGEPYFIKGVGGTDNMDLLVKLGGNSMRTWGADNLAVQLNEAHARGLTLTAGIWIMHRSDTWTWDNPQQLQEQRDRVRANVREHAGHPALLLWGLGNEMEVNNNNTPELWREMNELAKIVKEEDPHTPVMTVVAEISQEKINYIKTYAPEIDILGINSYGGMATLAQRIREFGWDGPVVIPEFGPLGPWERQQAPWGAAIEQTSSEKAQTYRESYENVILGLPQQVLGSYVFLWGHKQEHTPTWFGMFLPSGERTESIEVMAEFWGGDLQLRAPRIVSFETNAMLQEVEPGAEVVIDLEIMHPEGATMTLALELREELSEFFFAGEGERVPAKIEGFFDELNASLAVVEGEGRVQIRFNAPMGRGAFRAYVTVRTDHGTAGTANVPFAVR